MNSLNKQLITYSKDVEEQLNKELNYENYDIGKVLGFGSYAVVKLATHKKTGAQVAIKTYEKKNLKDPMKLKNVQREIKILSKFRHPNIIRLFQVLECETQVHLVMEYMENMPLSDYIKSRQNARVNEDQAKIIFYQIAEALRYCHKKYVVHRDIKVENILIGQDLKVKLIDFGFSVVVPPDYYLNIFCGTPSYMAPEIINKSDYTWYVDVWALAILLFKMCCGTFPFRGQTDQELYRKINSCAPNYPNYFSGDIKRLINKILQFHPHDRLSLDLIVKDEWITGSKAQQIENSSTSTQRLYHERQSIK